MVQHNTSLCIALTLTIALTAMAEVVIKRQ